MVAIRDNECEFFNMPVKFDINGFACICAEEELQQQIEEDDDFPVVCD